MTLTAILILGLAMSTDAFAVAIAMGARRNHIPLSEALRTGLLFGLIEGITPVIGWMLGSFAASYVAAWDHWIAFVLLSGLGLRMIKEGMGAPVTPTSAWPLRTSSSSSSSSRLWSRCASSASPRGSP